MECASSQWPADVRSDSWTYHRIGADPRGRASLTMARADRGSSAVRRIEKTRCSCSKSATPANIAAPPGQRRPSRRQARVSAVWCRLPLLSRLRKAWWMCSGGWPIGRPASSTRVMSAPVAQTAPCAAIGSLSPAKSSHPRNQKSNPPVDCIGPTRTVCHSPPPPPPVSLSPPALPMASEASESLSNVKLSSACSGSGAAALEHTPASSSPRGSTLARRARASASDRGAGVLPRKRWRFSGTRSTSEPSGMKPDVVFTV
mmetsp:Transcript_9939/g.31378  ORF Transcript_9939/g.31378 Transcript_9939/m.31378 type:complete len:259 (+) Transcript_9939:271-1047(+)